MDVPGMPARKPVPLSIRVELAHAAVATLARQAGVRILVLKGPGMDASVAPAYRASSDVDVLVGPGQLREWLTLLRLHDWRPMDRFETGSSFEHSQTFHHPVWGHVDVHRWVPGIGADPGLAFDRLWDDRTEAMLAGCSLPVPDPAAQALILCLHAARSCGSPRAADDVAHAWEQASPGRRAAILNWVERLEAHLGWAALTGDLDDYREDPAYLLWVVASRGGTRLQEWRARIAVAPTLPAKLRVAGRAVLVNTDSLTMKLGRPPTQREVLFSVGHRARVALSEGAAAVVRWLRQRGQA